jgi:predicted alpha/beta-hydrolase family hydrolase
VTKDKAPMQILFAHGAGLGSTAPWMRAWATRLSKLGEAHTFDYPYMRAGKKMPDRLPVLVEAHRKELEALRHRSKTPILLAGKSMGSRVSCHLAVEESQKGDVLGVVCFGYPLISASLKGEWRDAILKQLDVPILFVQGTRDKLCPLGSLEEVRKQMKAPSELFVVEGGDHSLLVGKRALARRESTQDRVDDEILAAIRGFALSLSCG